MRRTFYKTATAMAEKFILEEVCRGHYDEAFGAYQLWKRIASSYVDEIPTEDCQRLYKLAQAPDHIGIGNWRKAIA